MANLFELLAVKDIGEGRFESTHSSPTRNIKGDKFAYGGYTIGIGIRAAFASLPHGSNFHIYSALGNFLGPALAGVDTICCVRAVRDTRTFTTRFVEMKQQVKGALRTVMTIMCDFQVAEEPMMEYSAPPRLLYTHWNQLKLLAERQQRFVDAGAVSQERVDRNADAVKMIFGFFDQRPCPEGIFAQNLAGIAKHMDTTQDDLHITAKSTADWCKLRADSPAKTAAEHASAISFLMDSFVSFCALVFTHRSVEDSGAAGSLDFALRFFQTGDKIDFNRWHLRELSTSAAAEGRTYSEARLWDESGKLVASMTQQSILRPKMKQEKL